jgi:MYXO-CTERM domain-containing protein
MAAGTALEERWVFARNGSAGQSAGDISMSGSIAGMIAHDTTGAAVRAVIFGAGQISDQSGARLVLQTASAKALEANLVGTTLAVTGQGVGDFQAYSPKATAVTLNGTAVSATFEAGMITYPSKAVVVTPPADAGSPVVDAGTPDAGSPVADAGTPDAGSPVADAGGPGAGAPSDAGTSAPVADAGADPGNACGDCLPTDGGSSEPAVDAGSSAGNEGSIAADAGTPAIPVNDATLSGGTGCSSSGTLAGWLALSGLLVIAWRRQRRKVAD